MQVQYVSRANCTSGSGTQWTSPDPADTQRNDYYLAHITYFNGALAPLEVTAPAGWVRLARVRHLLLALAIEVWGFRRGANAPGPITFTFSSTPYLHAGVSISVFRNVRGTALLNASLLGDLLDSNVQLVGGAVPDNGSYLAVGVASQGSPGTACSSSGLVWTPVCRESSQNGAYYLAPANATPATGTIVVSGGDASADVCTLVLLSPDRDAALTASLNLAATGRAQARASALLGASLGLASVGGARSRGTASLGARLALAATGAARAQAVAALAGGAALTGSLEARAKLAAALSAGATLGGAGQRQISSAAAFELALEQRAEGGARHTAAATFALTADLDAAGGARTAALAALEGGLSTSVIGGERANAAAALVGGLDVLAPGGAVANAAAELLGELAAGARAEGWVFGEAVFSGGLQLLAAAHEQVWADGVFTGALELEAFGEAVSSSAAVNELGAVFQAQAEIFVTAHARFYGGLALEGEPSVTLGRPGDLPADVTWPIAAQAELSAGMDLHVQGAARASARAALSATVLVRGTAQNHGIVAFQGRQLRELHLDNMRAWERTHGDRIRRNAPSVPGLPWSCRMFTCCNAGLVYQGLCVLDEIDGFSIANAPRFLQLFDLSRLPRAGEKPLRKYIVQQGKITSPLEGPVRFSKGCVFGLSLTPEKYVPAGPEVMVRALGRLL